MKENRIRVLLVDDEYEACQNLQHILTNYIDTAVEIAGIAHNTTHASLLINELNPDAVFLDIDMPGENAFLFLERLTAIPFEVVFVTAYDDYAVKAFRLNAVDYILKPVNIDELQKAVSKLHERIIAKTLLRATLPHKELSQQLNARKEQRQIILRDNNTAEVVAFKHILYVEAMGSYARVVFNNGGNEEKNMIMSHSIAEYEELLPESSFFRTHRSYLVNCSHIKELIRDNEQVLVHLHNKVKLPVSRRRYHELVSFLKQTIDV